MTNPQPPERLRALRWSRQEGINRPIHGGMRIVFASPVRITTAGILHDMEHFSDAVRAMYPLEKDPQRVTVSPVSRIPVKVSVIFQVGLRRMIELSNSTIRETNLENLSSMCVIGRSAFETACLLYDVSQQVEQYVKDDKPDSIEELDKYLVAILLGHKSKDWALDEKIEARNILGIIRRLDKQFEGILMWFYDGLSEHAHPNYHGMLATYTFTKQEGDDVAITRFTDRRDGRQRATSIHVVSALAIAVDMVKSAVERYEEHGHGFAALAERQIYERGTWPQNEAYPVTR